FNASSGKMKGVYNEAACKQAMKCVCLTNIGELLGDPAFGCDLKSILFDVKNTSLIRLARQKVADAISKYVPSVITSADGISIEVDPNNSNVRLHISYYSNITGQTNLLSIDVLQSIEVSII